MTKGTQGAGAEVHPEKEDPGVDRVVLTQALHLGTPMTSSRHGGTNLTSLFGARESPHFLHACRDLPILEDHFPLTNSHLLSANPHHHHHTVMDAFHHALCRMTFLPDTTMTDHRTPHTALTTLRENILEICQVLLPITTPIRGSLPQELELIILRGVEASTRILAHPHMASTAIHPTCVIGSIRSKMTLVWCPMSPTLTCQLVSWLLWSNLRTVIINHWTLKTFACPLQCLQVIDC